MATEAWTLAQVRWVLEHLPELLLQVRPSAEQAPRARKQRRRAPPFAYRAAELVADLEQALERLRHEDAELFSVIRAAYLEPSLWSTSRTTRLAVWASEHGCSYASSWRRCRQAEERLLALLNGRPVE